MKLRHLSALATAAVLASCTAVPFVYAEKVKILGDTVVDLQSKDTHRVDIGAKRLRLVKKDKSVKAVEVVLEHTVYRCELPESSRAALKVHWSSRYLHCYELRSQNATAAFTWSVWSYSSGGNQQLISGSDGKDYLSWVEVGCVRFTPVGVNTDRQSTLGAILSNRGHLPEVVSVPVDSVLPEVRRWGVNALYADITVRSIAKGAQGNWTLQVSGPKSDTIYTIVCDKSVERGWRLKSEEPSLFRKEVPKELDAQIRADVDEIAVRSPLTADLVAQVRASVAGLNLKYPALSERHVDTIRKIGELGVPEIVALLTSQDDGLREKAIAALGFLRLPPRARDIPEYVVADSVLIPVFRRCVFDRSADVRRHAISALRSRGYAFYPSVPEGVKAGLQEASDDPDPRLRELARRYQEELGLSSQPKQPAPTK